MRKYFKIWWRVVKAGVMIRITYKIDWIAGMLANSMYLIMHFVYVFFLFEAGNLENILGYSQSDFLLVLCLSEVLMYLAFINVIPSVHRLADGIYDGKLDIMLIRPINPMIYSLIHESWLLDTLIIIFLNLITFIVVYIGYDYNFSGYDWLLIFWILISSYVIYGLMFFISGLIWFYWPKFKVLMWFLGYMYDINKYPRDIYPKLIQNILIYILPIFLVINPLYFVLSNNYSLEMISKTLFVILVFSIVYYVMFKYGLRKYESAA